MKTAAALSGQFVSHLYGKKEDEDRRSFQMFSWGHHHWVLVQQMLQSNSPRMP